MILGDFLRITTGVLMAINSNAQEIIIKSVDSVEFMGMIALMGTFVSALQL